jgi:molybdate transport system substrate-binding protein
MPRFLLLLTLLLTLTGCNDKAGASKPAPSKKLTVLAAASLADAFKEIGASFEAANPGVKVEFSFAGSNQLRTQLESGAPGDVFVSADRKQMNTATLSKAIDPATIHIFANNRLALIVPKENRAGIKDLADLAKPNLKIVVADKAVPVGNYTRLMLDKAAATDGFGPDFVKAFDANTVSKEENVAAVVTKLALNEADAGIAYASDASGGNGPKLTIIPLPPALEQRAEYPIAVTTHAADAKLAARFIDYVLSTDGVAKLVNRGFTAPTPHPPGAP